MSENKIHTTEKLEDEFEVLMARLLCKELNGEGKIRLTQIVKENRIYKKRYFEYVAMHKLINRFSMTAKKRAFADSSGLDFEVKQANKRIKSDTSQKDGANVVSFFSRKTVQFLSIAATVLIVLGSVVFSWHAGLLDFGPSETRLLTFPHRQCASGGQDLKSGDAIGDDMSSGSDSFCDAQISDSNGQVAVRLFPESNIGFNRQKDGLHVFLKKGKVMLNAKKRNDSGIYVHSEGYQVTVLGTRVIVDKKSRFKLKVDLIDGAAEIRSSRYRFMNELKLGLSVKDENDLEKEVPEIFKNETTTLEKGQGVTLIWDQSSSSVSISILKKLDLEIANYTQKTNSKPDNKTLAKLARKVLDQNRKARLQLLNFNLTSIKKAFSKKELWMLERSAQSMKLMDQEEKEKFLKIKARQINPEAILNVLKEKQPPLLLYRIHLKSGKIVTGIIEQQGNLYRLVTAEGEKMIPRSEVKDLEVFFE